MKFYGKIEKLSVCLGLLMLLLLLFSLGSTSYLFYEGPPIWRSLVVVVMMMMMMMMKMAKKTIVDFFSRGFHVCRNTTPLKYMIECHMWKVVDDSSTEKFRRVALFLSITTCTKICFCSVYGSFAAGESASIAAAFNVQNFFFFNEWMCTLAFVSS